ncbi:MAG: GAF domain-containing protein [Lewinellaceae bacterium]|nr:GAF domain-containing protein [Lewinellaceae bacterium]
MSATAAMPYFIKPSVNLSREEKQAAYEQALAAIAANLEGEQDAILKMATINCLLKTHLPYYYWVGFYLVSGPERLSVGPYQGTLGCLHIDFGRGVCGRAAREQRTQIVADTHALAQGSEHIACDPNSRSEIVVPVFDEANRLIAVFDVDSTLEGSFDEVDQRYLERLFSLSLTLPNQVRNRLSEGGRMSE